ncbi:hypothetical protein K3720_00460 [Leisingera caerulea]|uniref:NAD(P)-dependent oxidoreductase n=1 Tax=Leisingera caerulea TaxID=506591 RepID=UPI0021A96553|nr:NAD(P)-dependent oxidoreductase [Leisingera caerulea]UWQ49920.1 hypothetical protein K3720_00460 [Leisingera caerulea]
MMAGRLRVGVHVEIPGSVRVEAAKHFDTHHIGDTSAPPPDLAAVITPWWRGYGADDVARHPTVRYVSVFGTGLEYVDLGALSEAGIDVGTTVLDGTDHAVAECALALCLSLLRRVPDADRFIRSGEWERKSFPPTTSLFGQSVGIVGLGYIGSQIAARCAAHGSTVGYFGRTKRAQVSHRYFKSLADIAEASDVLFISCRGDATMRGMINAEILAHLGPEGYLINISKPEFVDETALITTLANNGIAGAALDVFNGEPSIDPRLTQLSNLLLHPHNGWKTTGVIRNREYYVIKNIRDHFGLSDP